MRAKTPLFCLLLLAFAGCADSPGTEPGPAEEQLDITCTGKCDGVDTIRSLYQDARDLDLTDLAARGTSLATRALNDALSIGPFEVEIDEPIAFGSASLAESEELVEDLDALTEGLLARFGENELSTEVNRVRQRHLQGSGDDVFIESGFTFAAFAEHGFSIEGDGFVDGGVSIGLGSGALSGRVVSAAERAPGSSPRAVLEALRNTRGFVVPESIEDLRAMKPGESFALRGEGAFGLNLGAGVPIVIAQSGPLAYNLVVSAALRSQVEGLLDVQVIRLEGDEVVIDVGTERGAIRSARLAVNDGWGVKGLVESVVNIAGQEIDLGRVLDRALRDQLNDRLNILSAEVERTSRRNRLSISRFRVSLSGSADVEAAISQALRGDIRLAQALSLRDEPGMQMEYDLTRSGLSSVSHAGLELFGMRFFRTTFRSAGEVSIETPGGAQELLFESLQRDSGWLFESHGYGRTILAGNRYDYVSGDVASEVNLFVQLAEGDSFTERDEFLDHVDALIVSAAGEAFARVVEVEGNQLQRIAENTCEDRERSCRAEILTVPEFQDFVADATSAINAAAQDVDATVRDLALDLADVRIGSNIAVEPNGTFNGPPTGVVLDYRLDDDAVEAIFGGQTGRELRSAIEGVLHVARVDRESTAQQLEERRQDVSDDNRRALDDLAATFDTFADRYQRLSALENAEIVGLGVLGGQAIAIDLGGDSAAQTIVQARSEAVRDAFDQLLDDARELNSVRREYAVAYALLAMVPTSNIDVRMRVDMDLSNRTYDHYEDAGLGSFSTGAQGRQAQLIGGGLFDVASLISVE
ncbi:MAG: hypothetical protein AAF411_11840 [Myxococcota bacterium]